MAIIANTKLVNKQAVKIFTTLVAWVVYLFLLPYVYASINIFQSFLCFFQEFIFYVYQHSLCMNVGMNIYLASTISFYLILSWLIFIEPQTFDIVHPSHHTQVNTYNDMEFHPLGEIKNKLLRIIYNFLEICLGKIFVFIVADFQILKHKNLNSSTALRN